MLRKLLKFALQFAAVMIIVIAAMVAWDLYHNGMDYARTPLFEQDLMTYGRIALVVTLLIFLVVVCYGATRRTLRLPDVRNDDFW